MARGPEWAKPALFAALGLLCFGLAALLLGGGGYVPWSRAKGLVDAGAGADKASGASAQRVVAAAGVASAEGGGSEEVYVYLTGAVRKPGVYRLKRGDRLFQAVELAGGLLPSADASALNLASKVEDGRHYHFPEAGGGGVASPVAPKEFPSAPAPSKGGKVNVNTASERELESLPGIGPALASRIVEHRQKHGPFRGPEDLLKVKGIGPAKLKQISPLVEF